MADDCCTSGDGCRAPPLQFPREEAVKAVASTSCDADAACGCHGGVPRFDGLDPRYKRILWTVIGINGAMFLMEMIAGQLAGSQPLQADALDFLGDTVTYGLSLAVIGTSLRTRATAALFKGLSLSLTAFWVLGSTIYHTIILGLPSAELMGGVAVRASGLMLMRCKDGDANVRSVWLCSRNDAIGNVAVMIAAAGVWGTGTAWPDLGVAALMAGIFLTSSAQILRQAWVENRDGRCYRAFSGGGARGQVTVSRVRRSSRAAPTTPDALMNCVEWAGHRETRCLRVEGPDPNWSRSNMFSDGQRPCSASSRWLPGLPSLSPRLTRTTIGATANRSRRGSRSRVVDGPTPIICGPTRSSATRRETTWSTSTRGLSRRNWRCPVKTATAGCSSMRITASTAGSVASSCLCCSNRLDLVLVPVSLSKLRRLADCFESRKESTGYGALKPRANFWSDEERFDPFAKPSAGDRYLRI